MKSRLHNPWALIFILGIFPAAGCAGTTPPPIDADNPPFEAIAGTWEITYNHEGTRTYTIFDNGEVKAQGGNRTAQLKRADHLLLDFGDDKVERLTLAGSRLLIEHWYPQRQLSRQSTQGDRDWRQEDRLASHQFLAAVGRQMLR